MVYMGLKNIESNSISDWFREREKAIGCTLTCTANKKAPALRQILSDIKEGVTIGN